MFRATLIHCCCKCYKFSLLSLMQNHHFTSLKGIVLFNKDTFFGEIPGSLPLLASHVQHVMSLVSSTQIRLHLKHESLFI